MKKIILAGLLCLVPFGLHAENDSDITYDSCLDFLKASNPSKYNGWIQGYFYSENLKLLSKDMAEISNEHAETRVNEYCEKHPDMHFADAVVFIFEELLNEDM